MERLTRKKLGSSYPLKNTASAKIGLFTDYDGFYAFFEAVNRLGEIEDILGDDYELDHLRELVQADRGGRCVVLPCKVGDIVWVIRTVQDGKGTNEVHKFGEIKQISINTHGCFLVGDYFHTLSAEKIGKIAFLSHEAAEKALKGQS